MSILGNSITVANDHSSDVSTNDVKPLGIEVRVNETVYCSTVALIEPTDNIVYFPVVRVENWSTDRPSLVKFYILNFVLKFPELKKIRCTAPDRLRTSIIDYINCVLCLLLLVLSRQGCNDPSLQTAQTTQLCRDFAFRRPMLRYATFSSELIS